MNDRIEADLPERAIISVGADLRTKLLGYCQPWIGLVCACLTSSAPAGSACLNGTWNRIVLDVSPAAIATAVVRETTVARWSDGRCHSVWNDCAVFADARSHTTSRSG